MDFPFYISQESQWLPLKVDEVHYFLVMENDGNNSYMGHDRLWHAMAWSRWAFWRILRTSVGNRLSVTARDAAFEWLALRICHLPNSVSLLSNIVSVNFQTFPDICSHACDH